MMSHDQVKLLVARDGKLRDHLNARLDVVRRDMKELISALPAEVAAGLPAKYDAYK